MPHSPPLSTKPDTDRSRSFSGQPTDGIAAYARDPFEGFFEGRSVDELIEPGSLLDTPAVRRWYDLFSKGLPESLYTKETPCLRCRLIGTRSPRAVAVCRVPCLPMKR